MQSRRKAKLLTPRSPRVISVLTIFTSDTLRGLASVSFVIFRSKWNLVPTLRLSEPVGRVRVPCEFYFSLHFLLLTGSNASIQLIERFYDPLAGDIYVSNSRSTNWIYINLSKPPSLTAKRSRIWTSRSIANSWPLCLRSLRCMRELFDSTSCSGLSNLVRRWLKKRLRMLVEMRTFWTSFKVCPSTWLT